MAIIRYEEDHWARIEDPKTALQQYLDYYEGAYNKTKAEMFGRIIDEDLTGKKVLDYGSGGGFMTVLCAKRGAQVKSIEAENTAINTARYYAASEGVEGLCTFYQSRVLPEDYLQEEKFDLIIAKDVIEHIEDDVAFLQSLQKHLKDGGKLILSTQNSLSLTYLIEGSFQKRWLGNKDWCGWDTTHLRFYSPRSLRDKLNAAGFKSTDWHSVYVVPYNIITWLLLRRKKVFTPSLRHIDRYFGHSFPLNRTGWNIIVVAEKQS